MSARRWQIVGGYAMSLWFVVTANVPIIAGQLPLNGWTIALGLAAGIIGHPVGRFMIREWQQAR